MITVSSKHVSSSHFVSIDIVKGIAIFPMIIGHAIGWWNIDIAYNYFESSLLVQFSIILMLLVMPCFLFVYGFNQTNSFIKRSSQYNESKKQIRLRATRRIMIFLVFATISMVVMAVVREPRKLSKILDYIFTWHLFHLFAFSTLILLISWELSHWIVKSLSEYNTLSRNQIQIYGVLLLTLLLITLIIFLIFHDYTLNQTSMFPVTFNYNLILLHALFDVASNGIIPWIMFPLAGGIIAVIINHMSFHSDSPSSRELFMVFIVNCMFLILGFLYLTKEQFVAPAIGKPSSIPHIFISLGAIGILFLFLLFSLDLQKFQEDNKLIKVMYPIIVVSRITLTIYLIHTAVSVIDPRIIPNELILISIGFLYSVLFVVIAHYWEKTNFKFSFEWLVKKFS